MHRVWVQTTLIWMLSRFILNVMKAYKTKAYGTFNEALDEFFLKVTTAEKALASVEVDKLQAEAKRLKRMVADQEKALAGRRKQI